MKIALIGFMGSGKTRLGRSLAKYCQCSFVDLDREIEKYSESTISNLFQTCGEEYFRKLEQYILRRLLYRKVSLVIATGGGTIENEKSRKILYLQTTPVWLDPPFPVIWQRIRNTSRKRPLVQRYSRRELQKLWQKRKKKYETTALLRLSGVISCSNASSLIQQQLKGAKRNHV